MNNLFIDGSMDDSLFLDDIPGLLADGDENTGAAPGQCGCDVKSMGKQYAYDVMDDIFPVSQSAALNAHRREPEARVEREGTTATIGFKNVDAVYDNSSTESRKEYAEPTHCIGRSADCGDWLGEIDNIAPHSLNIGESNFSDDDQAEHLSKMVGNRMRAELTTASINSRIIEGRLTAVNENFLMIEQPETGASIAYDMNLFKYFIFLPEANMQYTSANTGFNANRSTKNRHNERRRPRLH